MTPTNSRALRSWTAQVELVLKGALVAVAYFAAARLSLALAIPPGYAAPVWPASGIAVASVLLLGNRIWPAIWLAAALANVWVESSFLAASLIGAGNTLEALLGAALIRRYAGNPGHFERAEEVIKFIAIAALSAAVAATVAALPLNSSHGMGLDAALRNWWTWWQGDVAGILLFTPLILSWAERAPFAWPSERKLEAGGFALLLAGAAVALSSGHGSHLVPFSLTFIALPFIIWAALRLGQREVTSAIAIVCLAAVWYTVKRRDLFSSVPLNELLLMLLAFNSMVVATGLVLAAALAERRRASEALARYDGVTGLPNAELFRERLRELIEAAAGERRKIAVAVLDIERFRSVNGTFGRPAANALLKRIGTRLASSVGGRSVLACAGGDRFLLAVPGVRNERSIARLAPMALARWFRSPYGMGDTELRIAARMGLALAPDDGSDPDTLFVRAESALKQAKSGGERCAFYRQSAPEASAGWLSLEAKLRSAVERGEFELHYQPKVNVDTKELVGLEALLRWRSPELGLVPPGTFIPLLEESGMIVEVGRWVFRRAMLDQALWIEEGVQAPRIAVNVSAIQLRSRNFVDAVRLALSGRYLVDIEVTESRIMEDIEANIDKLRQLRALGIGIAIDDFGTGYSSLAYLARLPVQTLKIDRSFIAGMLQDDENMAVVQTIISLAQSLNFKTVAEGVETQEQIDILELLRCSEMQGYFIARPAPREAITSLLAPR